MSGRAVGLVFAAALLAFFAYAIWYQRQNPRDIVSEGTIMVERKSTAGVQRTTLRTRDVAIAGHSFSEVQLPGGTWIACGGDCRKAVYDAGDGFWEKIERDRGSR